MTGIGGCLDIQNPLEVGFGAAEARKGGT
jgi:hypothetical protein